MHPACELGRAAAAAVKRRVPMPSWRARGQGLRSWFSAIVLMALICGIAGPAFALRCNGQIVSVGDSTWEVIDVCGRPTRIESAVEILPELVYDALRGTYVHIPTHVDKSLWIYNFGPTQLIYRLTFRENTLVKIETGGYGG
jgi:hypothetical protein